MTSQNPLGTWTQHFQNQQVVDHLDIQRRKAPLPLTDRIFHECPLAPHSHRKTLFDELGNYVESIISCVEVGLVKRVHTLFWRNAQVVYEPSSGGSGRSATGGARGKR